MFNTFEKICITIIVVLSVYCIYLNIRNDVLRSELTESYNQIKSLGFDIQQQNNAVNFMKEQSNQQVSRLLLAQKDAEKIRNEYSKKIKQLINEKVPEECDQAIKWGAEQGSILYQCWSVSC